ncbi:hypothetical protein B0H13DRAFT_2375888 [Mycena leptocephala]|nr:hypothetical protein B0H13DRAFT_2375888 [Mycena leptocephala]
MTLPKKGYLISTLRLLDRANQRASRQKKKAKATASTNTGGTSRKRRASTSSADGRPTTRRRTDQSSDHRDEDQNSEPETEDGILGLEEDNNNEAVETYSDAESFFDALRADFKSGKAVDFHGRYTLAVDPLVSPKERVQMVATEIWQISGYRWTVKDHRKLKSGHRTRFWCSQDEARKKKSKASQNPDIRNRDNIATPLKGKIVEIGVDATYNTNSKHLELYSIMGEYDNAGFPVSYLLLSTASSIDQGKRRKALTAWAKCLRDTYGIIARFTHVDKDMAEIGMLKDVWDAKISLCWWHLRRAVRTRLAMAKLTTTPYDPGRANTEFSFIDVAFVPTAQADGTEYEEEYPTLLHPWCLPPSCRGQ